MTNPASEQRPAFGRLTPVVPVGVRQVHEMATPWLS